MVTKGTCKVYSVILARCEWISLVEIAYEAKLSRGRTTQLLKILSAGEVVVTESIDRMRYYKISPNYEELPLTIEINETMRILDNANQ